MKEIIILKKWIDEFISQYKINPTFEQVNLKIAEIIKIEKKEVSNQIDFEKLIAYYNKVLNKSCRVISKKAKDNFNQRLKEGYFKGDIVKVIDNVSHDNFHKETNYKPVTLEFLSRPNIFERYSSMEHKKPISQIQKTNGHVNY
jgi:uncharacterized phage protein (TIGR02220 family)